MDKRIVPASEIIKDAEFELSRAAALRAEAATLLERASSIEAKTRSSLINLLGSANGPHAFDLACLSTIGARNVGAVATPEVVETPVEPEVQHVDAAPPAPIVRMDPVIEPLPIPPAPIHAASTPEPVRHNDQSRIELWGVFIPSRCREEADGVIAEARDTASQGKKNNPYALDRGKNAWRKGLFAAVLAGIGRDQAKTADDIAPVRPETAVPPMEVVDETVTSDESDVDPVHSSIVDTEYEHEDIGSDPAIDALDIGFDSDFEPDIAASVDGIEQDSQNPAKGVEENKKDSTPVPVGPAPEVDILDDELPDTAPAPQPFRSHPILNRRPGFGNATQEPAGQSPAAPSARPRPTGMRGGLFKPPTFVKR